MEILSENVLYGEFTFFIVVVIAIALLTITLTIIGVVELIRNGRKSTSKVATIVFGVVAAVFIFLTISGFMLGPNVEYTALITDYNEVYAQGYEVLRNDGKLVILEKIGGR